MAAATATFLVPNSAASVNRSRRSSVKSAAVIQPAPIEHATNAAASGTVVHTPPKKACGSSTMTSSRTTAMPVKASRWSTGRWRSASSGDRRRIHMPSATGSASISRSCPRRSGNRSGEVERAAEGQLEPPADGRNGRARDEAREPGERDRQGRGGAGEVAVGVGYPADRARGHEQDAGGDLRRWLKDPREPQGDRRQEREWCEQARQHKCPLSPDAREVLPGEIRARPPQAGKT